ncbi:MAG: MmgE/PrpD family protein, partial [Methanobacteriaceae archaeon]|nr:MmgE/PrpD family protein [Methanobacteriaceae archaeon]
MIINEFSKFLINLQFKDIPNETIEKAKLCFLDYFSVSNRGLNEENTKILIKSLSEFTNYDKSLLNNGLIRALASHSLDLDDGHRLAFLHPGTIVFSTALSIIQDEKLKKEYNFSSQDFFESVIVGYEIAIVLGKLVNPSHRNQGFHSTGTIGTFISGAVASKLLKFDLNQTVNCLALCGTQSAGLLESDHGGSMGKALHAGKAVYNGLLSAILAKNGFTGAETIIEGDEGFLKSMVSNFDYKNKSIDYVARIIS